MTYSNLANKIMAKQLAHAFKLYDATNLERVFESIEVLIEGNKTVEDKLSDILLSTRSLTSSELRILAVACYTRLVYEHG